MVEEKVWAENKDDTNKQEGAPEKGLSKYEIG